MDQTAEISCCDREPFGVPGRHPGYGPPTAVSRVVASVDDVDPLLRRVSEGGATPL